MHDHTRHFFHDGKIVTEIFGAEQLFAPCPVSDELFG